MKLTFLTLLLFTFGALGQVDPPDVKFPNPEIPVYEEIITIGAPEVSYPGGFKAMKQHIQNYAHLVRWENEENSKRGYVAFIVEADGRLMEIEVIRGISPELDDIMLRIVEEMPRWIPACDQDGCYRTRVRLPITFVMTKE